MMVAARSWNGYFEQCHRESSPYKEGGKGGEAQKKKENGKPPKNWQDIHAFLTEITLLPSVQLVVSCQVCSLSCGELPAAWYELLRVVHGLQEL